MKLEVGEWYRAKNGKYVYVYNRSVDNKDIGEIFEAKSPDYFGILYYRKNGDCVFGFDDYDILEELSPDEFPELYIGM